MEKRPRKEDEKFNMSIMCDDDDDKDMSKYGSLYSIFNDILPSLGDRNTHRVKLCRFIVSPYDKKYR